MIFKCIEWQGGLSTPQCPCDENLSIRTEDVTEIRNLNLGCIELTIANPIAKEPHKVHVRGDYNEIAAKILGAKLGIDVEVVSENQEDE